MSDFPGLLGVVQKLTRDLRAVRKAIPNTPEWGTVTQVTPLRVKPDSAGAVLNAKPEELVGPLMVGDRVWTQLVERTLIVLGRAGGPIGAGALAGRVSIPGTVTGTVYRIAVSLPAGHFPSTPAIHITADTSVPQNVAVSYALPSPSGFDVCGVRTVGSGSLGVSWLAVRR